MQQHTSPDVHYRICFQPLKDEWEALEFPCDSEGRVELDGLNERQRIQYLFARAVIGCEFGRPAIVRVGAR
ncbi:MAG TPA: hypothetical protein VJU34_06400 [Phenylobacterium sp.]|nr:hypothetical protein [Phenylobacterium sp.]